MRKDEIDLHKIGAIPMSGPNRAIGGKGIRPDWPTVFGALGQVPGKDQRLLPIAGHRIKSERSYDIDELGARLAPFDGIARRKVRRTPSEILVAAGLQPQRIA